MCVCVCKFCGVRGVIFTLIGNGHGNSSSKSERSCLHFT